MEVEPYQMCCRKECLEREQSNEISIWERQQQEDADNEQSRFHRSTKHTSGLKRIQGRTRQVIKADPKRAVQKYRRSAAETPMDREHTGPYRSPHDLNVTVDYLLALLSNHGIGDTMIARGKPLSFHSLVEFVEDRIRAVQTDCVKWQGKANRTSLSGNPMVMVQLQAKLVRAHILVLYLMYEHKGYEKTFGKRALTTAISQFWNEFYEGSFIHEEMFQERENKSESCHANDNLLCLLDEMLVYDALFYLQQELCDKDDSTVQTVVIGNGVLESYRSMLCSFPYIAGKLHKLPHFHWAFQLVLQVGLGHWYSVLQHLSIAPLFTARSQQTHALAKCLLGPTLSKFRYKALQAYNVSWRKGEKLVDTELARLLHMDSKSALQFSRSCGLPVTEDTTMDGHTTTSDNNQGFVSLQSVPIHAFENGQHSIRANDAFVFDGLIQPDSRHLWIMDSEGLYIPPSNVMKHLLQPW